MLKTQISCVDVEHTLWHLQEAGQKGTECVVLWLGRQEDTIIQVQQVYRPTQVARPKMFYIPLDSMNAIMSEISSKRLMIAAQVHSHPFGAFHSNADDAWAIVRHEGALSLVIPCFALNTSRENFMEDAKLFRLTPKNKWCEVSREEIEQWLVIS